MSNSKALQRQEYIMNLLAVKGEVSASELASKLNVSIWTVRRDLDRLKEQGVLSRFYGGANPIVEPDQLCQLMERDSLRMTADQNLEAKRRIGATTARLLHSGERAAIGGGNTTLEVVRSLKANHFRGEIVTNALDIALELAEEPEVRVVCTGGDLQPRYHTLVGSVAERMLKLHYFDVAVIGVSGISLRHGITVNSQVDATALELMIEHSCRTIMVADHSKFGRVCFVSLAPNTAIHTLVTDEKPSPEYAEFLMGLKVNVILADK